MAIRLERHFNKNQADTYAALIVAAQALFGECKTDSASLSVQFETPASGVQKSKEFVAEVKSEGPGSVVRVTGAAHGLWNRDVGLGELLDLVARTLISEFLDQNEIDPARPAAAWYPDPDEDVLRYWDGTEWTDDFIPLKTSGAVDEKGRLKVARKAQRQADELNRTIAAAVKQRGTIERYGQMVASGVPAAKTIRIYDKGFVQVSGAFRGADSTQFEHLLSIEDSSDVSKKSGLGRGLGMAVTGGMSIMASNKRGDVYLAIVTDSQTYMLHEDPPTERGMKAVRSLAAAGSAVIESQRATEGLPTSAIGPEARSAAPERLRQLKQLHEEGLLSAEEFDQLRAKLLDEL